MNDIKNKHFFLKVLEFIKLAFLFACLSCLVVAILSFYHKDFFFIEDAQNDLITFMHEMGTIWLSGHLPILSINTLFGGNILLDMANEPFAPQTIITSIIAVKTNIILVMVLFFSWISIMLVSMGGYYLGLLLKISRVNSITIVGFLIMVLEILYLLRKIRKIIVLQRI